MSEKCLADWLTVEHIEVKKWRKNWHVVRYLAYYLVINCRKFDNNAFLAKTIGLNNKENTTKTRR